MKPGLPAALTMIVFGSGVALASFGSRAEQSPANVPVQTEQQQTFSPADRAAFLDARIAALHAGLKLSPDQEKLWPPLESALRVAAKSSQDRYQKFKNEPKPASLVDRLRRRGENAVARGQNLEAIADASAPLYAALNEDQKHRLPVLVRGLIFHRHFASMGDGHEHSAWWRGGRDNQDGCAPQDGDHSGPNDR
jgi:zinc resistance-associated protein